MLENYSISANCYRPTPKPRDSLANRLIIFASSSYN